MSTEIYRGKRTEKFELINIADHTNIQPSIIQDIGRTLRQLVEEMGLTVLLVEQYYDFAKAIADHYWVMSRGEIVAGGEGTDMEAHGVRELIAV